MPRSKRISGVVYKMLSITLILSCFTPAVIYAYDGTTQQNEQKLSEKEDVLDNSLNEQPIIDSTENKKITDSKENEQTTNNKIEQEGINELNLSVNTSTELNENPTHTNNNVNYIPNLNAVSIGKEQNKVFGQFDDNTKTFYIVGEENAEINRVAFWNFLSQNIPNTGVNEYGVWYKENTDYSIYSINIKDPIAFDTNSTYMFRSFPGEIILNPNIHTENVTDMQGVFELTKKANPDISKWNVSNVVDMSYMFDETSTINPDVSKWNVGSVQTFEGMFRHSFSATPDTSNWDTKSAINMNWMFDTAVNSNPNTTEWNVSNVKYMNGMFQNTNHANPDVSKWDTKNVEQMAWMFNCAKASNPNATEWNVGNVNDMQFMFNETTVANPDVSKWNTRKLRNASGMFRQTISAKPNVSNWNTESLVNTSWMFDSTKAIEELDLSKWNTQSLQNAVGMFEYSNAKYINTNGWNTNNLSSIGYMYLNTKTTVLDVSSFKPNSSNFDSFIVNNESPQTLTIRGDSLAKYNNSIYLADTTHYIYLLGEEDKGYLFTYKGEQIPQDIIDKLKQNDVVYKITDGEIEVPTDEIDVTVSESIQITATGNYNTSVSDLKITNNSVKSNVKLDNITFNSSIYNITNNSDTSVLPKDSNTLYLGTTDNTFIENVNNIQLSPSENHIIHLTAKMPLLTHSIANSEIGNLVLTFSK